MNDHSAIALNILCIGLIIVDPVAIKGQSRITKQQGRIEGYGNALLFILICNWRRRFACIQVWIISINQILPFCQA